MGVRDIIERFEKGEIGPREICYAMSRGELTSKEAAELIGVNEVDVAKYCRELLREETQPLQDYSAVYQPAQASGRGRSSQAITPYIPNPVLETISQVSALVAQEATRRVVNANELGVYVYDLAYYFCATDPRYRDALMVKPMDTVKMFINHAIAFYVAYKDILASMEEEIDRATQIAERLLALVDRYKRVVKSLIRRTMPSFVDELTAKLLVALVDRYILAKALGVPVDRRFTSFISSWLRSKGVEYSLRYLGEALGLEPEELEEVIRK